MADKRIISIDSQILNSIQACARKTQYQFVDLIEPQIKSPSLEEGALLHDMLEFYESTKLDDFSIESWCARHTEDLMPDLINSLCSNFPLLSQLDEVVKTSAFLARFWATKLELAPSIVDETIHHFSEYCKFYRDDGWHNLAVEEVGSKVLYEDEDIVIIYNFKIDKVAEKGRLIMPWDHKHSRRRSDPSSLSNQFLGYCWGLGMNSIMINKIGFQKTLKPQERFTRDMITYSEERIEEWKYNSINSILQYDRSSSLGSFPMNLTSCDKYSGCIYSPICSVDPILRDRVILRDFKRGTKWDVGELIAKESV